MSATAELAIRMRRAAFNRALAEADLAAIRPILAPYAVVVTGTDSAVRTDRKAQLDIWKRNFASPDRAIYTRLPDTITVSPVEPIAMEHGQWQGVMAATGQTFASGSYTAKWRETGGEWVIEAEIYVTLGRAGPLLRYAGAGQGNRAAPTYPRILGGKGGASVGEGVANEEETDGEKRPLF